MLPFTNAKITNLEQEFIYDRNSKLQAVARFSYTIFYDLRNYLGIEQEVNRYWQLAAQIKTNVDSKIKEQLVSIVSVYDMNKIERINILYNHYLDILLDTMMVLYYTVFDKQILNICVGLNYVESIENYKDESKLVTEYHSTIRRYNNNRRSMVDQFYENIVYGVDVDDEDELIKQLKKLVQNNFMKSGKQLSNCFKLAQQKCEPMYQMIKQQINDEYPTDTFAGQHAGTAKKYKE